MVVHLDQQHLTVDSTFVVTNLNADLLDGEGELFTQMHLI